MEIKYKMFLKNRTFMFAKFLNVSIFSAFVFESKFAVEDDNLVLASQKLINNSKMDKVDNIQR